MRLFMEGVYVEGRRGFIVEFGEKNLVKDIEKDS